MMEPQASSSSVSMGKPPAMQSPTRSAAANAGAAAAAAVKNIPVPKVVKEQTDAIAERISKTDIARINGYMRFANLVGAALLAFVSFIRMFKVGSYSEFLVIIYIMMLTVGLIFIENHEQFPSIAEKVKLNFGFMFTAPGKATYIISIAFLSFSQAALGVLLGVFFFLLGLFNFFLIYRHPAYQQAMTQPKQVSQLDSDLEMPELRVNKPQTEHVVV